MAGQAGLAWPGLPFVLHTVFDKKVIFYILYIVLYIFVLLDGLSFLLDGLLSHEFWRNTVGALLYFSFAALLVPWLYRISVDTHPPIGGFSEHSAS